MKYPYLISIENYQWSLFDKIPKVKENENIAYIYFKEIDNKIDTKKILIVTSEPRFFSSQLYLCKFNKKATISLTPIEIKVQSEIFDLTGKYKFYININLSYSIIDLEYVFVHKIDIDTNVNGIIYYAIGLLDNNYEINNCIKLEQDLRDKIKIWLHQLNYLKFSNLSINVDLDGRAEDEMARIKFEQEIMRSRCNVSELPLAGISFESKIMWQEQKKDESFIKLDKIQFSAITSNKFVKGEYLMINIIMYENEFRYFVDEIIDTLGNSLETKSEFLNVESKSKIKIYLTSPDLNITDNMEEKIWDGEYNIFPFAVMIPVDFKQNQILFISTIYINDIIATKLKFIVSSENIEKRKLNILRSNFLSAFISYASQDRARIASIILGMKKARPDLDIFFDVDNLRSGDDWQEVIKSEIEIRDIFFLCWSNYAKKSKWVDFEWRYALDSKGIDYIEPIPIDPPDVCPPPEELKKKHFNDRLLYIINSYKDSEYLL